jgi:hypothetical protein
VTGGRLTHREEEEEEEAHWLPLTTDIGLYAYQIKFMHSPTITGDMHPLAYRFPFRVVPVTDMFHIVLMTHEVLHDRFHDGLIKTVFQIVVGDTSFRTAKLTKVMTIFNWLNAAWQLQFRRAESEDSSDSDASVSSSSRSSSSDGMQTLRDLLARALAEQPANPGLIMLQMFFETWLPFVREFFYAVEQGNGERILALLPMSIIFFNQFGNNTYSAYTLEFMLRMKRLKARSNPVYAMWMAKMAKFSAKAIEHFHRFLSDAVQNMSTRMEHAQLRSKTVLHPVMKKIAQQIDVEYCSPLVHKKQWRHVLQDSDVELESTHKALYALIESMSTSTFTFGNGFFVMSDFPDVENSITLLLPVLMAEKVGASLDDLKKYATKPMNDQSTAHKLFRELLHQIKLSSETLVDDAVACAKAAAAAARVSSDMAWRMHSVAERIAGERCGSGQTPFHRTHFHFGDSEDDEVESARDRWRAEMTEAEAEQPAASATTTPRASSFQQVSNASQTAHYKRCVDALERASKIVFEIEPSTEASASASATASSTFGSETIRKLVALAHHVRGGHKRDQVRDASAERVQTKVRSRTPVPKEGSKSKELFLMRYLEAMNERT